MLRILPGTWGFDETFIDFFNRSCKVCCVVAMYGCRGIWLVRVRIRKRMKEGMLDT